MYASMNRIGQSTLCTGIVNPCVWLEASGSQRQRGGVVDTSLGRATRLAVGDLILSD